MQVKLEFIYKIECTANSKVYVGRTCNLARRKREHFKKLSLNKHVNKNLQNSFNKYGSASFKFSTLEQTDSNCVKERELHWFNTLKEQGIVLFNHNISSSDGGVDSKSHLTRAFIFDALDDKYSNLLTIEEFCIKYKTSSATYYTYLKEWEDLRSLQMPRSVQQVECLKRMQKFVDDFKIIGKDAYRNLKDYKLSHQALVKHLPRFGFSFEDVRLDNDFRTTKDRAMLAISEMKSGKSLQEVVNSYNVSSTSIYKYMKELE